MIYGIFLTLVVLIVLYVVGATILHIIKTKREQELTLTVVEVKVPEEKAGEWVDYKTLLVKDKVKRKKSKRK